MICEQTENAASRIKNMLAAKDDSLGVKVGVKRRKYSYIVGNR